MHIEDPASGEQFYYLNPNVKVNLSMCLTKHHVMKTHR
jgi:hypothetical protein